MGSLGGARASRAPYENADDLALKVLIAIVALALAKGLVWSLALPPWYGPDEPSHYSYIQVMVEDGWLPQGQGPDVQRNYPPEIVCSEANLGIGALGPFAAEPPFGQVWSTCQASSPLDRHALSSANLASAYSALYYVGGIPFYLAVRPLSVEVRLQAVRLWSVLLGVLASMFAFLAARWAFLDRPRLAMAVAVLFTLQPMNSQQTAVVNNDALLIAVAAAFWWRYFRALKVGLDLREAAIIGLLLGLAYLAKPQGLALVAALPVLYLMTRRRKSSRNDLFNLARLAAVSAIPCLALVGCGELVAILSHNTTSILQASSAPHALSDYLYVYSLHHFERVYWLAITSFWGYFGWFQADLPNYVYVLVALAEALGLVGALWLLLTRDGSSRMVLAAALGLLIPAAIIQMLELVLFLSRGDLIVQGRSYLMLLIPLLVILLHGWRRLVPDPVKPGLGAVALLAAYALNLASLFVIVDAFYG